jgi:ABC-type transport system involved in cytochrome bd biosynthesis fused ATPase/permease subunit
MFIFPIIFEHLKAQEGRTTIIVAHRLATIREVDQILVFQEGKIVESGTHEELYNKRGIFYDMVNQQQIQQRDAERSLGIVVEGKINTYRISSN